MQSYQNFDTQETLKLYNCERPDLPAIPLVQKSSALSIARLFSEEVSPKAQIQP